MLRGCYEKTAVLPWNLSFILHRTASQLSCAAVRYYRPHCTTPTPTSSQGCRRVGRVGEDVGIVVGVVECGLIPAIAERLLNWLMMNPASAGAVPILRSLSQHAQQNQARSFSLDADASSAAVTLTAWVVIVQGRSAYTVQCTVLCSIHS